MQWKEKHKVLDGEKGSEGKRGFEGEEDLDIKIFS